VEEVMQNFWLITGWATFWAIFEQTRLGTLFRPPMFADVASLILTF
jgi:hypothetical protein